MVARYGGYVDGVPVRIGVLEGEAVAGAEGGTVVDEAVVEPDPPEYSRVDEAGGAEPPAADVDVGDGAAREANVQYLYGVRRYAVR